MKKTPTLLAGAFWMGAMCIVTQATGAPQIQFDQTVYDFGKTSQVTTVSGVFKFKNVGDAILKLEPPKPSCGCTTAELKPDTLAPGATGELPFTLNLGFSRAALEKHIAVRSNDPQTPEVSLTIKVDYTPLYDVNPMTLAPHFAFGANDSTQFTTITRTDGKPLRIAKLETSKPWIAATVEPAAGSDDTNAHIRIAMQRDGSPRRFNEYVHVYADGQTNTPVSSIYLYGQIMGEVSLSPEALYWSVPNNTTNVPADRPEALVLRRVAIHSAGGQPLELKNPQSSLKGITVELLTKEAGKAYELVVRLEEMPTNTVSGNVSFETSVAAQPRIEVPVIINVFKP
jgi:hypothetical protein